MGIEADHALHPYLTNLGVSDWEAKGKWTDFSLSAIVKVRLFSL